MVNIIVVFPKPEDAAKIRSLLVRSGYRVVGVCVTGSQVLQILDGLSEGIVVSGYKVNDMLYSELKDCLPPGFELLLIASQRVLAACRLQDVVGLSMPIRPSDLVNTIEMMSAGLERRRRKPREKPQRTEEEKRLIQEAKELLMERNHLTEEEAHRYMQKCSMDSGNSMVETAKMVFTLMKD